MELNRIYNENCLETMKRMPDGFVDLVVTDPPYGIGLQYDSYDDTIDNWKDLFLKTIPEFKRVAKMVIMPCCQIRLLPFIYQKHPPDWLMCWYKGSPGHMAYVGFNDWEPLLVYGKNDNVQMHDYLAINNNEAMGSYGHPCPKPLAWYKWIIHRATKEGDLVYDAFMGSGTMGLVAHDMKRNWIGSELSKSYFDAACKRIENHKAQLKLTL